MSHARCPSHDSQATRLGYSFAGSAPVNDLLSPDQENALEQEGWTLPDSAEAVTVEVSVAA